MHGASRTGDRVAMLSPNNDALVVQLFACWWLGAVACPLNLRWSVAELRHALADCGARLLLVDAAHASAARELAGTVAVLPAETLAAQAPRPQRRWMTPAPAAMRWPRSSTPAARPGAPRA